MRKLLRFVGFVAGVGAVTYLMRDRLVRIPEDPGPPPHFKVPSPNGKAEDGKAATAAALADDLTEINGIGPAYAERLAAAGITSFAGLAEADADAIAESIDVSAEQVADWAAQAAARS